MLQHDIGLAWLHQTALAHFVNIDLPECMDFDLVTIFQLFEIDENTRRVICIPNVTGDDGVASPGWKGSSIQPA